MRYDEKVGVLWLSMAEAEAIQSGFGEEKLMDYQSENEGTYSDDYEVRDFVEDCGGFQALQCETISALNAKANRVVRNGQPSLYSLTVDNEWNDKMEKEVDARLGDRFTCRCYHDIVALGTLEFVYFNAKRVEHPRKHIIFPLLNFAVEALGDDRTKAIMERMTDDEASQSIVMMMFWLTSKEKYLTPATRDSWISSLLDALDESGYSNDDIMALWDCLAEYECAMSIQNFSELEERETFCVPIERAFALREALYEEKINDVIFPSCSRSPLLPVCEKEGRVFPGFSEEEKRLLRGEEELEVSPKEINGRHWHEFVARSMEPYKEWAEILETVSFSDSSRCLSVVFTALAEANVTVRIVESECERSTPKSPLDKPTRIDRLLNKFTLTGTDPEDRRVLMALALWQDVSEWNPSYSDGSLGHAWKPLHPDFVKETERAVCRELDRALGEDIYMPVYEAGIPLCDLLA